MRIEAVDWEARLEVRVQTEVQAVEYMEATLFAETVAAIHVYDVPAIAVKRSNGKLISEQVQVSRRKVKQRADTRIGLTIIVAQVTFEVPLELGNAPVKEPLPPVGEAAIEFD